MSRKTNRDHAKKKQRPMVEDQVIAEHLTNLLTPAMKSQSSFFRELGLRDRILTLVIVFETASSKSALAQKRLRLLLCG